MATNVQDRVASSAGSDRTSGRDIETIVEEFTGEPALAQDLTPAAGPDASASLTPRAKSSLAKKLAKSLGFHSHKDDTSDTAAAKKAGPGQKSSPAEPDAKQQSERGVHFTSQDFSNRPVSGAGAPHPAATLAASTRTSSSSSAADKQLVAGMSGNGKYISPFLSAQHQPSGALTEVSTFYSPTSSFNSVASSRVPKALSASLDDDGSQMRKSRMAPGNPMSYSGDLEQMRHRPSMLEQTSGEEHTVSGILSAKSHRSSALSLKSMDGRHTHVVSVCNNHP